MEARASRLWDEIAGQEREKWSNFHITVNLNEAGYSRAQVLRLGDFVSRICARDDRFKWIQFRVGKKTRRLTPDEQRKITSIRARVAVEKGTRNHSLHAHILMEIGHRTCIGIDYQALKGLVRRYLGGSSNLHVRFIMAQGESLETILHYISKTVARDNELDL